MGKFYIDFSGYCIVDATSAEDAENKFWENLQPPSQEATGEVYEINCIEEE